MTFCFLSDALSMHLLSSLALCCLEVELRSENGAECECKAFLSFKFKAALSETRLDLVPAMPEADSDMTLVLFPALVLGELWRSMRVFDAVVVELLLMLVTTLVH